MLLLTSFPPDIRVEKEIESLHYNNKIFLLCPLRNNKPKLELTEKLTIIRIFNTIERWLSNIEVMFRIKSILWISHIRKFVKENKIDVLHVHDLPLLYSAHIVAKELNIKLVSDLHENYPEMLAENLKLPISSISSIPHLFNRFINIEKWKKYEKTILNKVDSIIVVVDESKNRLLNELKINGSKIYVVPNFDKPSYKNKKISGKGKLSFFYAGGFDYIRDLYTVLDAYSILPIEIKNEIEVTLIGGTGSDLKNLINYCKNLKLNKSVKILGYVPFDEMHKIMVNADVGLVPHVKSRHTDSTIPHKLFQYMALEMPVIVSDCDPLKRIVNDSNCGLVYKSKDPESLKKTIINIYSDTKKRNLMAKNAKNAVDEKYNWNHCTKELQNLYNNL